MGVRKFYEYGLWPNLWYTIDRTSLGRLGPWVMTHP